MSACSCAPSRVPDVPACQDLAARREVEPTTGHQVLRFSPACERETGEPVCGHCTYIVSGREVYVGEGAAHRLGGKPWSEVKASAVLFPAEEAYAPLAVFLKTGR